MSELESQMTCGLYAKVCNSLAKMYDEQLGHSGEARYLESLAAGISEEDSSPLLCSATALRELDGYYRRALGVLLVQNAVDQRELWTVQRRMDERIRAIRVCGCYTSGLGAESPVARG